MEILAFIPPVLIGSALVVIMLPQFRLKGVWAIFTICLGFGIGLGLTSSTIFLWLACFGRPGATYHVFEIGSAILLTIIAAFRFQRCRSVDQHHFGSDAASTDVPIGWLKRLVIILLLISSGSRKSDRLFEKLS